MLCMQHQSTNQPTELENPTVSSQSNQPFLSEPIERILAQALRNLIHLDRAEVLRLADAVARVDSKPLDVAAVAEAIQYMQTPVDGGARGSMNADQTESASVSAPAVASDLATSPNPNVTPDAATQTGAVGIDLATSADAVLVINSPARARVAGMAAFLTLQGVAHVHETVGLLATITVLRADVAYVLEHWQTFSNEGAAAMIAQLEADRAAGVTVWPVDASTETYVGTPMAARDARATNPTPHLTGWQRQALQLIVTQLDLGKATFAESKRLAEKELGRKLSARTKDALVREMFRAPMASPARSIRQSHEPTARENRYTRIAATAAQMDLTELRVLADEFGGAAQGTAWELDAHSNARRAVRYALAAQLAGKDWAMRVELLADRRVELATESPAPAIRVVLATRTRVLALCEQLDLFQMAGANDIANGEPAYRLVAPSEQKLATATMPAEYVEPTRSNVLAMVERLGLFVVVDPAKYVAGEPVYRLRAEDAEAAPVATRPTYGEPQPFSIKVHGKKVVVYSSTILQTRLHFLSIALACIEEARTGKVHPNNPEAYLTGQLQAMADSIAGKFDHTASFRQMAVYFQTGESVGLLG